MLKSKVSSWYRYSGIIKLDYEPALRILVQIAYAQKPRLNDNPEVSRMAIGLHTGASLHLHPYIIYSQLQKKPISYFSGQIWKAELRNENIFIPCSLTCLTASTASSSPAKVSSYLPFDNWRMNISFSSKSVHLC